MDVVRWRYEVRLCGWRTVLGPLLALAALAVFAVLISFSAAREVNPILSFGLDLLPLVAGIAAASAVSGDGLVELQLSLPTSFRLTVVRRLVVALGWPILLTLIGTLGLSLTQRLVWPVAATGYTPLDVLIWLPPLLWLAGCGAAVTLGLRNIAAATGAVGLVVLSVRRRSGRHLVFEPPRFDRLGNCAASAGGVATRQVRAPVRR